LGLYRRLQQASPAAFEPGLAATLNNLGIALNDLGDSAEARVAFEEALAVRRRLAQTSPAAFEPELAGTLSNLGIASRDQGEPAEARAAYEEAVGILASHFERSPAAFRQRLRIVLRNYISVTPRDQQDRWWQLWEDLNSPAHAESPDASPTAERP